MLFYGQMVPLLIGVFMVARFGRGREPAYGAAVAAVTLLAVDLTIPQLQQPGEIAFHWIVTALVFGAGAGLRTFERRAHESTRRAVEAEVAATEQAARAVLDERTRIARELHDIVAHSVSSMVVQAGAAEQAVGDEEFRDRALAGIRATGTDALGEMRRLVTMLRDDDDRPALAPSAPAGRPGDARRAGPRGRHRHLAHGGRRRASAAGRARPRGVPDRPGGTDERPPPRRRRSMRRHAATTPPTSSSSRSPTTVADRSRTGRWRRPRPARHARAGGVVRRLRGGRRRPRRRLPGPRPAAPRDGAPVTTRVLVVDDQELVRAGFRMILERGGLDVVGEAVDGVEAVALATGLRPDVVLMDVRMPRHGRHRGHPPDPGSGPETRVVALTTFDLDEYVYEAVRAGASGFLLKDISPTDLLHAVGVVARGDSMLAPALTRRLLDRYVSRPRPGTRPAALERLTGRELEVLTELAKGRSNAEIGGALFLSEATVKTYVSHLLTKLALRDRVQLAVLAYETGLVEAGG